MLFSTLFSMLFSAARAGVAGAVSALPDPAERRLGLRRRLMLAVAPGAAGALLVVALPARNADHGLYCAAFVRYLLWAQQSGCDRSTVQPLCRWM